MAESSKLQRRELLKRVLNVAATLAVANTGVYAIGAAFKNLDGSFVAGAKHYQCDQNAIDSGCNADGNSCSPLGYNLVCHGGSCTCVSN